MKTFLNRLIPFIFMGIAIVLFVVGIWLLAYLFLLGAMVGFILFAIAWIRQTFFPSKSKILAKRNRHQGRVIDTDDWKKM